MKESRKMFKAAARVLPGVLVLGVAGLLFWSASQSRSTPENAAANQAAIQTVAAKTTAPPVMPGELDAYPKAVSLTTNEDRQQVVVRTQRKDGVTLDLTRKATYIVQDTSIAKVSKGIVTPVADGKTTLIIKHAGKTTKLPITVQRAAEARKVSFRLDVIPVFSKAGCNNGACHGSARGQDGFNLSLFGFDPAGDYKRIVYEQPGRRINRADTKRSMLLTKSVGEAPHTGGKLFGTDHAFYKTLKDWLDAGAPDDPKDVAEVTAVEIFPQGIVLEGKGAQQQVTVRAHYSDGSDRDVTHLAVLMTSNDLSAKINNDGLITAGKRGEAFIMARFDAHTVGTPAIIVPEGSAKGYPDKIAAANYIDKHINAKLRKMRIVPSEVCDDKTYARRVYIDIIGQLPTIEQLKAFLDDKSPDKRAKLVDKLLEHKAFTDIWVMKWAERLQIRSSNQTISPKAAVLYHAWLKEQIAKNRPMNQVVYDLLATTGGTFEKPATNFYEVERDRLKLSENVVQVFIGARMQCAQCHNHPFDKWTMDDYYGFAAFFAQVARKPGADPRESIIFRGGGDIRHPLTRQNVEPRFLGGEKPEIKNGTDRREVVAKWLTSPENKAFNRNLANFVWDHFFGRGITHPIDDVRISNPPVNPALLAALGDRLVETKYDVKQLIRDICASHAYQRTTQANKTNAADTTNFSRANVRRIRAEVLLDCISQVTGTIDDFRGLPPGAKAVQIVDGNTSTTFLQTFGRSRRETVCSCEVTAEPNLSQALHLINGNTVNNKIRSGGLVRQMLKEGKKPAEIITHLYLAAFSREPSEKEMKAILALVETSEDDQRQALEDVFWALLNAKEFMFNH